MVMFKFLKQLFNVATNFENVETYFGTFKICVEQYLRASIELIWIGFPLKLEQGQMFWAF
jgi:hypothetical protein